MMFHDRVLTYLKNPELISMSLNRDHEKKLKHCLKQMKGDYFVFDFSNIQITEENFLGREGQLFWVEGLITIPYDETVFIVKSGTEKHHKTAVICKKAEDGSIAIMGCKITNNGFSFDEELLQIHYRSKEVSCGSVLNREIADISMADAYRTTFFHHLMLLNTKSIEKTEHKAPHKLNKVRAKSGKPLLHDYTVISLAPTNEGTGRATGTHASPRPHWRRGHIRRLHTGAVVPVMPCLVNAISGEGCTKTYEVRA